jgi:hypothetical protein
MANLSDGCEVGIFKRSTGRRGVCRRGAKCAQAKKGIIWTQASTESMKYEN